MNATRSFAKTFARALAPKVFLLAVAFSLLAPNLLNQSWATGTDEQVMSIRPDVVGSPAALVAEHDCWTGEAAADVQGKVPGHVVVTVDGVTRVGGQRMVGKALDQIFNGIDHDLTIAGFCR